MQNAFFCCCDFVTGDNSLIDTLPEFDKQILTLAFLRHFASERIATIELKLHFDTSFGDLG